MNEVIREFLLETQENLAQLDIDLVTLEKDPAESETLARIFRTLHTVKGTAGFLGLMKLQAVAHSAENLLTGLTSGEFLFNAAIASALLATVDAIRRILEQVERTEQEGDADYSSLIQTLEQLRVKEKAEMRPNKARKTAVPVFPAAPVISEEPRLTAPPPPLPPPPRLTVLPASPPTPPPGPPPVADFNPVLIDTGTTFAPRNGSHEHDNGKALAVPFARTDAPEPAIPETARQHLTAVSESSIRVDVGLLDKLMTFVGELVLARNQIVQFSATQEDTAFLGAVQRLNLLTTELQAGVMKTRMQPIGNIWSKFPRLVRDLAMACAKEVRFEMEGRETELDKTIIEAIRDPLTHMVRNAVDHGIEPLAERKKRGKPVEGRVSLHAFHEGGKVIIEVADDGGGIDPQRVRAKAIQANLISAEQAAQMSKRELLQLIFQPGFSTADKVTHFSGRGVGMNVVLTNVKAIGGTVDVESCVGLGTTIRIKIPLTLAIIPALTVMCGGDCYAIPQLSLLELVRLEGEQARRGIEDFHGAPVFRLRGNLLPLIDLSALLQVESTRPQGADELTIVVLHADDRQFGLLVDEIHDTEEIVVKPLQKHLKEINVFAGATIMGDGRVALIIDVLGMAQRANVVSTVRDRAPNEKPVVVAESDDVRQTVVLFAAPGNRQLAIPLALIARLEEFPRSSLERIGNQHVVLYRGDILPLIDVAEVLQFAGKSPHTRDARQFDEVPDTVQVVVHSWEGRLVGLMIGEVVDIVEEAPLSQARVHQPCVLFTAVIQGRATEVLDMEAIIRIANPEFYEQVQAAVEEGI